MQPRQNSRAPAEKAAPAGWGLIEILIALAITAIIATLAYPSYSESVRKARRAEGRAALLQLMHEQERYYARHNTYAAFSRSKPNGFKWYSGNAAAASAYEISADACPDETLRDCVMLTAQPGTAYVDAAFRDETCGSLRLSSDGGQEAQGGHAACW